MTDTYPWKTLEMGLGNPPIEYKEIARTGVFIIVSHGSIGYTLGICGYVEWDWFLLHVAESLRRGESTRHELSYVSLHDFFRIQESPNKIRMRTLSEVKEWVESFMPHICPAFWRYY